MATVQAKEMTSIALDALSQFNTSFGSAWSFGTNWSSVGTQFETFINKFLFPKLNETKLIDVKLGNRFNWLAKEVDFIGQYSEEYVIMDSVPVAMNLTKNEELMLKRNYPKMVTKLYGSGIVKKQKFTLNNNDTRLNWKTLADGVGYALGVYNKKISDINITEESEMKAMLVDYSLTNVKTIRPVTSMQDLSTQVTKAILNMQSNSAKYNESSQASGGAIGRYTTQTKIENVMILTNDDVKTYLLDTKIANTFENAGIDYTQRIMSFDDLGGVFKTTQDITIAESDTILYFKGFGDYQVAIGDLVPANSVFTFDVTTLKEFIGKVREIKPDSELFAFPLDIRNINYKRFTKGMLKAPFNNSEFDETTHWLHYYSYKAMSPFYNKIIVKG